MKRRILTFLFIGLLFPRTGEGQVNREASLSQIQRARILLQNFSGDQSETGVTKCFLPAISYALENRSALPKDVESALATVLQRPERQKNILVGRFRVHYDTVGIHAAAMLNNISRQPIPGTANQFADSVAAIANYVYMYETDSLGYLPPPLDTGEGGGSEYDIYVEALNYYGETVPENLIGGNNNGGTYTTYMRIDNDFAFVRPDSNKGLPALRVTLAHELHHAIQLGRYAYWLSDRYFYEITSTWMEDVLYTNVNDYYQYVNSEQGQFKHTEVSFTDNSDRYPFLIYSRCIWGHYVAKKFGRDTMRRIWEEIRTARPLSAMDAALQQPPYSTTFRNAFVEWSIWNYFTGSRNDSVKYYPEGRYYQEMITELAPFTPPSRSIDGSTSPLSSRYYDVSYQNKTLTLLLSNVNVSAAQSNPSQVFSYSIALNQSNVDESYSASSGGIFFKMNVADPTNWYAKDIRGTSGVEGAFPNPFIADGNRRVNFPISSQAHVNGTVSIFSSSADLVYSAVQTSEDLLGKEVFWWDGRNQDNNITGSGIYLYIIESPTVHIKGKIAVLRK